MAVRNKNNVVNSFDEIIIHEFIFSMTFYFVIWWKQNPIRNTGNRQIGNVNVCFPQRIDNNCSAVRYLRHWTKLTTPTEISVSNGNQHYLVNRDGAPKWVRTEGERTTMDRFGWKTEDEGWLAIYFLIKGLYVNTKLTNFDLHYTFNLFKIYY